jgi:glutathione synthase/RimK-type ligase-like ATP-grasp enzyme
MGGFATKRNVSKSLLTHKKLSQNVPDTRWYSKKTLKTMLDRYKMVYIKPNNGTGGRGIMRAEKLEEGYKYQFKTSTRAYSTFANMIRSMEKQFENDRYVIQQGIHLLQYNGRIFDLRVMVQKNHKGKWETTGIVGRIGHPKKIVTNVCRGGSSKSIEALLKNHVPSVREYKKRLNHLGSRTARQLNKTFPRITQLGLDIGIDRDLHPWILEANPRPAIYGFKYLKDKSMYQKIVRYQNKLKSS